VRGPGVRVFAAYAGAGRPWLGTRLLDDLDDVCSLDVAGLAEGPLPSFEDHPGQLLLVCTHGKHDACCAERGRPLAAALAQVAPAETWEVSHIGGDRFAANLLALPTGHYYGRLEPEDAARLVRTLHDGRLDLDHLRGRTASSFPVQAAEVHLRRHLGEDRVAAVRHVGTTRSPDRRETTADFEVDGAGRWSVLVRSALGDERLLTCRSSSSTCGLSQQVVELLAR
jgi:hypothetical protein